MTGMLAAFGSFTIYVLTHGAACWARSWRRPSRLLNLLWLAFLPVYVAGFLVLSHHYPRLAVDLRTGNGMINLLNGLLIQVLLLIGYTAFFFLLERGLSLRVTIEISRAPQGRMKLAEIMRVYSYDYILEKRIGQMLDMDYWRKDGGDFVSTDKGRRFAAANKLVWKLLRIDEE
jgi:pimeloyl-ACP methyl ester carboxylesterase